MRTEFILGLLISFTSTATNVQGQDTAESKIFGGSKKSDFNKVIIELRGDGTGNYLHWTGPHGWSWRNGPYEFQWTTTNDSLKIKFEWDRAFQFAGQIKNTKLLTPSKGPFNIQDKYVLITKPNKKRKAKEKLTHFEFP